jgi:ankyrin repeat protein
MELPDTPALESAQPPDTSLIFTMEDMVEASSDAQLTSIQEMSEPMWDCFSQLSCRMSHLSVWQPTYAPASPKMPLRAASNTSMRDLSEPGFDSQDISHPCHPVAGDVDPTVGADMIFEPETFCMPSADEIRFMFPNWTAKAKQGHDLQERSAHGLGGSSWDVLVEEPAKHPKHGASTLVHILVVDAVMWDKMPTSDQRAEDALVSSRHDGGVSRLADAVRRNDLYAIKESLATGADPNGRLPGGLAVLQLAILRNHPLAVLLLLENGSTPGARLQDEAAALFLGEMHQHSSHQPGWLEVPAASTMDMAMHVGNSAIIAILLAWNRENVSSDSMRRSYALALRLKRQQLTAYFDAAHRRAFDSKVFELILTAAKWGDLEAIKLFVSTSHFGYSDVPQMLTKSSKEFAYPMHATAANGHVEVLRFLLQQGAPISQEDHHGRSPIHAAASRGQDEAIVILLGQCASVMAEDARGWTAMHHAANKGCSETLDMLLREAEDSHGRSIGRNSSPAAHLQLMRSLESLCCEAPECSVLQVLRTHDWRHALQNDSSSIRATGRYQGAHSCTRSGGNLRGYSEMQCDNLIWSSF